MTTFLRGAGVGYSRVVGAGQGARRVRDIRRVLWVILILNIAVALAKLFWGIFTNSDAMQADGFHSLFDGASNVVGLVGMAFAARPADEDHPYGHSKYETYASALIAGMLVLAAYRIGSSAVAQIVGGGESPRVDVGSFVVMIGTLAVNIFVTTWERRVGKKLGSQILVADASHTGSDVLVSLGVIVSLVLVKFFHLPLADPIVALLVALAIVYTAWGVFKQASNTLSDSARIPVAEICAAVMKVPGVLGCHHIRTRGSEAEVYADLHIQVDSSKTVAEGHEIAETVERMLVESFDQIADAIVHLEPYDEYQQAKTAQEMPPS
ncbi:MAG: cation transporter [Coriobacteriia bacterium]|nr:cation transporter [Coriobacteriia bacterium]